MSQRTLILILAGVLLVGLINLIVRVLQWRKKKQFAQVYLDRLRHLVEDGTVNAAQYDWLVTHSVKMQTLLGHLGLKARTATPYETLPTASEPLILNTLAEIRAGATVRPAAIAPCEDALMQYLGTLQEERTNYLKQFVNPIFWLGTGIRTILLLPLLILQWLGLFKDTFVNRFASSTAFSVFSGLVAVMGTIMTAWILLYGWDSFSDLFSGWMGTLLSLR